MYRDLDERLDDILDQKRKKHKWTAIRSELLERLEEQKKKVERLERTLKKAEEDVRKLEGVSLSNFIYTLLGKKMERLDLEKRQAVETKLKYDEAVQTVEDLEVDIRNIELALAPLQRVDEDFHALLEEKERLIKDQDSYWSDELYHIAEQKAALRAEAKEYEEALQAGKEASDRLWDVIEGLERAKDWSMVDLFGGGLLTTMMKHERLNTAKGDLHHAQHALRKFESELKDIERQFDTPDLEIGSFLTFADFFFDGLIVDWAVHGRISDSLDEAQSCFNKVTSLNLKLKRQHQQLMQDIEQLKQRRIELIKRAQ